MGLSVVIQGVKPPGRIQLPPTRVRGARREASCLATSLVSVSKSQRWQIVLAVMAGLLAGSVAQREGSSLVPHQTPSGTTEVSSASLDFQRSTEVWHVVEQDARNRSTEGLPDQLALGTNLHTRNPLADLIGTTVPFHIASTFSDPSRASGHLSSSSPRVQTEKNSSGVLDLATSSFGGSLAKTHVSLGPSSKGLGESADAASVLQPVEKRQPGLNYTTELFRPGNGSSLHFDVSPALQTALSHPSRDTSQIPASSIAQPTIATIFSPAKLAAPEGSTQSEQHLAGTSLPGTQISRRTHLDQKSTSHRLAATSFFSYQAVAEPSASPEMTGMSLSHPTLSMGTIPSEATHVTTDVFHSDSRATTHSFLESILRVSTGLQPGSLPTLSPDASSQDTVLLPEAVLKSQGLGSTKSAMRDALGSTAVPTMLTQSSSWPLSSYSHGVTHTTLPDLVTLMDSSETKGLATQHLSRHRLVPTSLGSPEPTSDEATALSAATDGIQVTAKSNTEVSPSMTFVMQELGAPNGVSIGRFLSGPDLATVSALTGDQTLSYSSTTQGSSESEATSRFPFRNTSLLVPPTAESNSPLSTGKTNSSTASQLEPGTASHNPHSSQSGLPSVHLSLSTVPLELDAVPAEAATEGVPFAPRSAVPGEGSTSLGSASRVHLAAYLHTAEVQEGSAATSTFPSEGTTREWKKGVSSTAELSADVPGHVSILDSQSDPTVLDVSPTVLPAHALSLSTVTMAHSRDVETRHGIPFLHSWASLSTSESIPSADVTDSGSSREQLQRELHDGTGQFTITAKEISTSTSALPLSASGAAPPMDIPSSSTSAMLGLQPTQKHFSFPRKTTRSMSSSPPSFTFVTISGMNTSTESFEASALTASLPTEGGSNAPVPTSTTRSNATLSYQFLDEMGVVQPFWTTAAGTPPVEMAVGSPSPGKEFFSRTPSEWRHSALPQVGANRTEVTDTSRAADTSTVLLVRSPSFRGSSEMPANFSLVESKSTMVPHPAATQAVSPTPNTTTPLDSSRVLSTASVLTTRAACSGIRCFSNTLPVSSAPLQRTSTQLPITYQTLPKKVLVTTLGSTVGKKETTAGLSTMVDTPKMTYTTAFTMKPVATTRSGPTSKQLVSALRASTIGQTGERDNFPLRKQTMDLSILSLQFQLARIEYTESLMNKSSSRYKKLEREVTLTLNKMLSSYKSFLQANVLRFLSGSVVVQSEAVFQGGSLIPTPSDMIRTIITVVQQRKMDTFFDWRVDLKSLRSNEFSLRNLEPEVLAISFTVLGRGSVATFGGLTHWGPLERLRNEVVLSLGIRYRVQNFSLAQVRNIQGDLDISGEMYVNTEAHVDIGWALEALKGLANYSVDLGSICINGSRLSLQIFRFSFLVTNRIFNEKLLDRSSMAHQSLSWDLSKALMHMLGQYQNLLQVTIREMRGGSLICQGDVIFQPPAPTSKDVVHTLALSVGPKNYLGASNIQVDPFSFTVAGAKLEPPFTNPSIPSYGIALIFLGCLAVIVLPFLVLLYKRLSWKGKMVLCRAHDPEVMVETFELENPGFRSLTEDSSAQSCSLTEALG